MADDGIITVKSLALRHADVGDYVRPTKPYPNGRLRGGGHGQVCTDELDKRGITYQVGHTYSNGVRVGGVDGHKKTNKRIGNSGQSWFPETWTDTDIRAASTFVANTNTSKTFPAFADFRGLRVGIYVNSTGAPSTIFPDGSLQS